MRLEKANYRERKASGLRKEQERDCQKRWYGHTYILKISRGGLMEDRRNFKGSMINRTFKPACSALYAIGRVFV